MSSIRRRGAKGKGDDEPITVTEIEETEPELREINDEKEGEEASRTGLNSDEIENKATVENVNASQDASNNPFSEESLSNLLGIQKRPFSWTKLHKSLFFLVLAFCGGYLVNPRFSRVNPSVYQPDAIPYRTGVLSPNELLADVITLRSGDICEAADILSSPDGSIYVGCLDGNIRIISAENSISEYYNVGTPILGLQWGPGDSIIISAGDKGLLHLSDGKVLTVLATGANGLPFKFVNSAVVTKEGLIYFTDGSHKFTYSDASYEALEMALNGRLLVHSLNTGVTETAIEMIACAAGVALSTEEDFLLISDSFRSQIARYWLKGPQKQKLEFVAKNLPGYPSKISTNEDGTFWVALPYRRSVDHDYIQPLPVVKTFLSHFASSRWLLAKGEGWVLKIDRDGDILESLEDRKGSVVLGVSSVRQHGHHLLICAGNFVGFVNLVKEFL